MKRQTGAGTRPEPGRLAATDGRTGKRTHGPDESTFRAFALGCSSKVGLGAVAHRDFMLYIFEHI